MTTPTLSPKTAEILASLRANVEGETFADGKLWGWVYLENAHTNGTTPHAFAGHLAALKDAGLYRTTGDTAFGKVLLP